jgi:hypothetical protein
VDVRIALGRFELEPLTAMAQTRHGPLFLTRVMPGRWLVQAAGTEEGRGPIWTGERFQPVEQGGVTVSKVRFSVPEDGLEDAVAAARDALGRRKSGQPDGSDR